MSIPSNSRRTTCRKPSETSADASVARRTRAKWGSSSTTSTSLSPSSERNLPMAKAKLDFDKLARGLGAERRGQVKTGSGYVAAAQLAAELAQRLRVPAHGGRPTDPTWTERRIVPLR